MNYENTIALTGLFVIGLTYLTIFLRWKQQRRIKVTPKKIQRRIDKINSENNTSFQADHSIANHKILFDIKNNKIYFIDVQGLNGIRDFSFFEKWYLDDSNHPKFAGHLSIQTQDINIPLITINYPIEGGADLEFHKLSAMINHN